MSYRVIVIGLFFLLPERSVPVRCALEDGFRRMVVVFVFSRYCSFETGSGSIGVQLTGREWKMETK